MSEFHDPGPFGPPKDITDPRWWDEQRRLNKGPGGPGGWLGLPLGLLYMLPLMAAVGIILYPLTAAATIATGFLCQQIVSVTGLTGVPMYVVTFGPGLAVLWMTCRWDIWFAQNKIYWWARHIARCLLFVAFMIILSDVDGARHKSDAQQITAFLHNQEELIVTGILFVVFNIMLLGPPGVVRSFWHAGLEIIRLRPEGIRN